MQVSHQEKVELRDADIARMEDMDHQAAKMAVCAIECIKPVDLTPGVMRIIMDALSHKLDTSNMRHIEAVQSASEYLDDAATAMQSLEQCHD